MADDVLDDLKRYKADAMRCQDTGRQYVYTRDDGSCPNCGHVTTDAEHELLAERRKVLDEAMRERFAAH